MKQSEIVTKVKNAILLDIAVAEYHKSLIGKLKWNPRKDGKPRANFRDCLSDDPYLQAVIFAYCDGDGDFRFGFTRIDNCTTNKNMATDIFKKFNTYQIPNTTYIYKNFCTLRSVNSTMTPFPMFDKNEAKKLFDFIVTEFPKIIDQRIAAANEELKIIDGPFSEALAAYIKATVEFRKEFFDITKHRAIASTLMDISDYEWTSLVRGD